MPYSKQPTRYATEQPALERAAAPPTPEPASTKTAQRALASYAVYPATTEADKQKDTP